MSSYGEIHTAQKIKREMEEGTSCIYDEMSLKEMMEEKE